MFVDFVIDYGFNEEQGRFPDPVTVRITATDSLGRTGAREVIGDFETFGGE